MKISSLAMVTLTALAALPVLADPAAPPARTDCQKVRAALASVQSQPSSLVPFPTAFKIDGADLPPGPSTPVSGDLAQDLMRNLSARGGVFSAVPENAKLELDENCTTLKISGGQTGPGPDIPISSVTADGITAKMEGAEVNIHVSPKAEDARGLSRIDLTVGVRESIPLQCGGDVNVLESHDLFMGISWYHGPQAQLDAAMKGPLMDKYVEKSRELFAWAVDKAENPTLVCPRVASGDSGRIIRDNPYGDDEPADPRDPGDRGSRSERGE
ncbi:MAG TPA: hypothetical protein VL588_12890 [Bdellovibrionota bacterium]|nr:hypothetical protein [Bdellovibrionota bacterium]